MIIVNMNLYYIYLIWSGDSIGLSGESSGFWYVHVYNDEYVHESEEYDEFKNIIVQDTKEKLTQRQADQEKRYQ